MTESRHLRLRAPRTLLRLGPSLAVAVLVLALFPASAMADGGATKFLVAGPSEVTAGDSNPYTVTAADDFDVTDTSYTGTVDITCSDLGSDASCPTPLVPADFTSGVATVNVTFVTAGPQTITADDGSIHGTSDPITVDPAAANHLVVAAPGSATVASAFTVTVTATDPYGNTDTNYGGTVHFTSTDGSIIEPIDYPFVPGDAGVHPFTNEFTLMTVGEGTQTITATDAATSSIQGISDPITVNKATPVLSWTTVPPGGTLVTDPGSTTVGASIYTPAASSASSPVAVVISLDGTSSGCSLVSGDVHFNSVGTCKIDANQTSNGDWNAATQIQQTITIAQASTATALTLTTGANPSTFGDSLTFTAHVTSAGGNPTGSVQFFDGATSLGTNALNGSDNATLTISTLTGGTHATLTAHYLGDTNFAASTSTDLSQTVNKATPVLSWTTVPPGGTLVTDPGSTTVGASIYTPAASSASSPVAVVISLDGTSSGCSLVSGDVHFNSVGTCKIDANQTSNGDWNAATQIQQTITIAQASTATALTLTTGANPSTFGDSLTFTAHVTSAGGNPTGSVQFFDGATSLGTNALNGSDNATLTISTLTGGTHATLTAHYLGDTNFAASTSTDLSQTVNKATPVLSWTTVPPGGTLVTDPGSTTVGASIYTPAASSASSPVAVVISLDGTSSGCSLVSGDVHFNSVGTCKIDANQTSNGDWNAATQIQQTITITGSATSTTTISSGTNPTTYGGSVTFTATVTGAGATPGGTVQFKDGTSNLGTPVTLSSGGVAHYSTSALIAGHHSITAAYSGDSNYATSTSNTVDQNVQTRPITVTANSGQTKVYGNADPTLTYTVTTGSLVSPDVFSGSLVRAAGTGVGLYAITQGTLALSANYTLSFVGANFSITARPITVTANSGQTKVYGNADPVAFAYTVTTGSLVSPDIFSGSLVRAAGTGVGLYAITQGTLALSANYTLSFVGANFSITARPITVTANSGQTKVYGNADPVAFAYTVTTGSLVSPDVFSGSLVRAAGDRRRALRHHPGHPRPELQLQPELRRGQLLDHGPPDHGHGQLRPDQGLRQC